MDLPSKYWEGAVFQIVGSYSDTRIPLDTNLRFFVKHRCNIFMVKLSMLKIWGSSIFTYDIQSGIVRVNLYNIRAHRTGYCRKHFQPTLACQLR
jgi:hypothetical protein